MCNGLGKAGVIAPGAEGIVIHGFGDLPQFFEHLVEITPDTEGRLPILAIAGHLGIEDLHLGIIRLIRFTKVLELPDQFILLIINLLLILNQAE